VIGLVGRGGKIPEADADPQPDIINDEEEEGLHGRLNVIQTHRSLASAYLNRMIAAQATVREVRSRLNLDLPEDRRRAIEALLEVIKVSTVGSGRQKRAELTFSWLGQEPYISLTLKDVGQATTPLGIMNDADIRENSRVLRTALSPVGAPMAYIFTRNTLHH
jgi:hypothetical protein